MSELFKAGQMLGRSEMKKIMAGSGGYCIPGWACHIQPDCVCSVGFPCCCDGELLGCVTSWQQCTYFC